MNCYASFSNPESGGSCATLNSHKFQETQTAEERKNSQELRDGCKFLFLRTLFSCKSRYQLRLGRVIYISDEHVHSCFVLDDTLAESVRSRVMLVPLMVVLQHSHFDYVFSLFCHSLQLILIVTMTCSDLDDSHDIHTTCLACCVVVRFSSWFSQLVCWNTVHMESGLEGISCLWKPVYKSGQDLSVNLSDYLK